MVKGRTGRCIQCDYFGKRNKEVQWLPSSRNNLGGPDMRFRVKEKGKGCA